MSNHPSPQQPAQAQVNPWAKLDAPILPSNDLPVSVCRVLVPTQMCYHNSPGDRVSLDPKQARWLAQQGFVVIEAEAIKPSEIRAAGGFDAWLLANPKQDKLSKADRSRLRPIPGLPDGSATNPWDFM